MIHYRPASNCVGRRADEPLFPIADARKTLSWINEQAGTCAGPWAARDIRKPRRGARVFGSAKADDESRATGDVTLGHDVAKSEAQLRAGCPAVADFVEEAARTE